MNATIPIRRNMKQWPKPWEFTIRAARNEEGETIRHLVDETTRRYGWETPQGDWNRIAPFWYIAIIEEEILGALQVCLGWPFGRIEFLSVRQGLSRTKRAKIVKALIYHVFHAMVVDGTPIVMVTIPREDEEFTRILERWGFRYAMQGKMLFYSLPSQR